MTPVGVFFICQNEDKCHFVNSTKVSRGRGILVVPPGQRYNIDVM